MSTSLTAVREVWAQRDRARTRADLAYLVYVVALSAVVLVLPVLRMLGGALARPDVLEVLLSGSAPQITGALVPLAAAVALLVGAVRGPALLAPFFTAVLVGSDLPRRTVLRRPFARALTVPVLGAVILAALISSALGAGGHIVVADGGWFVLAAAGTGLLLGAAWLLGQLLGALPRRLLAVAGAAAAAAIIVAPAPVLLGAAYPVGGASRTWALALLIAGAGAVMAGIPLLDRLRGSVLAEQAARWESAAVIATTGDLAGVAGQFRARPTTARRVAAIGPGPLPLLYARRDLIAWLRTPERTVVAALVLIASAAVLAGALLLSGPLALLAVAAGSLGMWGASGAFVDGLAHAVHTLGAPPLLGQSASRQALLHALAPMLLIAVLGVLGGGGLAAATGVVGQQAAMMALLSTALAPVLVAGRVRDAAKGPMPLSLATPMPTAQGDLSIIPMLVWQSDAILLALGSGIALNRAASAGPVWLPVVAGVATVVLAAMTRSRLRGMRG